MSDSLSPREIEDVLSSIRRLVSQEAALARAPSDRLLLTPSLRVVNTNGMPEAANGPASPQPTAADAGQPDGESVNAAVRRIAAENRGAAGSAPGGADAQDAEAGAPSMPQPRPDAEEAPADVVIDEAMLRDLVAQILREELHGTMGERLTRSIRKLVRAEVARALSEREFL
ncbi:hypothetical protein HUK65_04210 [Rhodobacteraceae bacterium 2376]|uniref:Uncharacterized protein n=1 Tax=Rhabdonatronobacter sediminivivens TaxID=2743469 RepID=A0A7Z0KWL6_9RHOB|nr:hypothetical protein [Rhabdonatronobacter sediminivivens]NYS24187.1 hypothetical protein [Rhabdonatronobacter sediminivivens]